LRDTWVVKELDYLTTIRSERYWKKKVATYRKTHGEMPLLASYRVDNGRFDPDGTKQITQRVLYEVTHLIPGPVPLAEFDVKQFLPPEADYVGIEVTRATMSAWRIICIVLGIILLAIGIGLQIKFRKQNKDKPE
jgi:hypothetical protein